MGQQSDILIASQINLGSDSANGSGCYSYRPWPRKIIRPNQQSPMYVFQCRAPVAEHMQSLNDLQMTWSDDDEQETKK